MYISHFTMNKVILDTAHLMVHHVSFVQNNSDLVIVPMKTLFTNCKSILKWWMFTTLHEGNFKFSPIYSTSIDRRNSSDMSSLCASKRSRILKIILTQRKILSDIIFVPSIQNFKQLKMWQNWCFSVSPVYSFGKPPQHFYEVVPTVWMKKIKFL